MQGRIFVTGPDVVRSVTGEDVGHGTGSGGPSRTAADRASCTSSRRPMPTRSTRARELVDLLGHQVTDPVPADQLPDTDLGALLPDSRKRAYDVHPLIAGLLDEPGIELHPRWAPNIVTTLGRMAGADWSA